MFYQKHMNNKLNTLISSCQLGAANKKAASRSEVVPLHFLPLPFLAAFFLVFLAGFFLGAAFLAAFFTTFFLGAAFLAVFLATKKIDRHLFWRYSTALFFECHFLGNDDQFKKQAPISKSCIATHQPPLPDRPR